MEPFDQWMNLHQIEWREHWGQDADAGRFRAGRRRLHRRRRCAARWWEANVESTGLGRWHGDQYPWILPEGPCAQVWDARGRTHSLPADRGDTRGGTYWDGAADVAETTYTPFQTKPDAAPVRLIVRRVKPTPGSQLALFARYRSRLHHRPRWGDAGTGGRSSPPRRGRGHTRYGVGLNHMPSGRLHGAWLAVQVMAHNLARWTARIGLGQQIVTTKTLGGGSSLLR